jgi:manganese oxidase
MNNRRSFFSRIATGGAALFAQAQPVSAGPLPVETPDLPKLPHRVVNGAKEFHLTAEVVRVELMPGRTMDAWGYNGSVPGPTIEVNEGDRVRVVFENRLPEPTAVHWHGFEVPMEMDGSVGLGQDPVPPGGTFVYEFTLNQHGTFFYHSHFPMQEMMGQVGLFIMHPKRTYEPRVVRDFGLVVQEWALLPNNNVPNSLAMEFNWLTFNGKAGPNCTPMIVKQGERVRVRIVNIGMDHHPIHLHGMQFVVTGTEGGRIPESMWYPQNTVIVGVAQARNFEFEASYTGDWMLHCHLPHHMMNQMIPMVGPITHGEHAHHTNGPVEPYPKDDPVKKKVPGYPQDMWMVDDGPYAARPENHGLRPGWSGAMMGMMTLVRVVTPPVYEKIQELKREAANANKN